MPNWDRSLVKNRKFKSSPGEFNAMAFIEAIEGEYEKKVRSGYKQKKSFAPSGLGYGSGKCPRYWYHAFEGTVFEDTSDALGMANMENGSSVHERLQGLIGNLDGEITMEQEVLHSDPPIRGYADIIVMVGGKPVVGEIKSMKNEAFGPLAFKMVPPGYHLLQLVIYLRVLGAEQGFFLYENKNDNTLLIIPITMNESNEELADYAFEWMRTVYKAWEQKTIPNRPYTKSNWVCKSCPVRKTCWDGEAGTVDLPVLEVPK